MRAGRGGGNKKPPAYLCSATDRVGRHPVIPQEPTDEFVSRFIVNGAHEQGFVMFDDEETSPTVDRDARLAELEDRRRSMMRRNIAGQLSDSDFDEALALIATQVSALGDDVPAPTVARSDIRELVEDQRTWSEVPIDRQRAIVREFATVTILLASSTRQPVYRVVTDEDGTERWVSERIQVELNLDAAR